MKSETLILIDLEQLKDQEDYDDFVILSHYLQQSPSNMVQYLYTASDGSLLEVDIYATVDGQLRKSVSFDSFEQSNGFSMGVTLVDLEKAIKRSKQQSPLRYKGICATRWEEIKFLVGEL